MGPMILKREVLPPRQPPRATCAFTVEEVELRAEVEAVEAHRAAIMRAIWLTMVLIGLAHVVMRMLEMYP